LVVYMLDPAIYRNFYNPQTGQVLAYVLHDSVFANLRETSRGSRLSHAFGRWIVDVLRCVHNGL
jgi:hypothetical protein